MDNYQPVEINVLSAQDLDSVNLLFRSAVCVSVSVTCGSRDHQITPAAVCCKKLLQWNYRMKFYIEEDKIQRNESVFVFQINCKRLFGSEQVVGKLFVPVKQLRHLNEEKTITEHTNINYQVITETGKPKVEGGRTMDTIGVADNPCKPGKDNPHCSEKQGVMDTNRVDVNFQTRPCNLFTDPECEPCSAANPKC